MHQTPSSQSQGQNISSTSAPAQASHSALQSTSEKSALQHFIDNDAAYLQWIGTHPDGFVVNCYRNPSPSYLPLHRATCPTISKLPTNAKDWAKDYGKVCSIDRTALQNWAEQKVHGTLKPCGLCHP